MSDIVVTVNHTIGVPKESKEVIDFLTDLIEDIKAGKPVGELTAENLPNLMTAIEGYDQIPLEVKGEHLSETLAYAVDRLGDVFGK